VTAIPESLHAAIAGRYDVERELGRGGMATVYLARDAKHQRQVALKVLKPDLAASLGADRFLKEIEIVARLTHPHILALYDSCADHSCLYYVMPFIEGGSLRQRLERDRRLEPGDALAIAGSVADALTYAHRQGVLHRDIKPENILFAQGHPIVADFGIAKAIVTAGGENLTRTGFPLGTPGYMSPEQAAGLTDLDERTDVYGLAVVVYEMLVGQVPGRWPTEEAVREGRFLEATPSHRAHLDRLPAHLEGALVRGLATRHDQRTPTPAALLDDLASTRPRGRRYNEEEVRALVQRAAELEVRQPTTVDGAMTIGGIERVAEAAGIPRALVRQAAVSAEARPAPAPSRVATTLIGGPTFIDIERVVEGEVPDTEYATLVDEVRSRIGQAGIVSSLGRSVTWIASEGSAQTRRPLQVTVSVRAGRTRIHIRDSLTDLRAGLFGGVLAGVGAGGLGPLIAVAVEGLKAPAVLFALVPAWVLTVFSSTRSLYHYRTRARQRQLEDLADRLAALARDVAVLPSDRRLGGPVRTP
jgi:tRNA A-37 threonylcarbamoyl transferase component Bud32